MWPPAAMCCLAFSKACARSLAVLFSRCSGGAAELLPTVVLPLMLPVVVVVVMVFALVLLSVSVVALPVLASLLTLMLMVALVLVSALVPELAVASCAGAGIDVGKDDEAVLKEVGGGGDASDFQTVLNF